jgi:hypothetical protein
VLLSQVGGFYNPANRTFYMVEREGMTYPPFVERVLIAHELTHALDDQYVSLDSLMQARDRTQDGEFVTGALVEGSATEIMSRYLLRAQTSGGITMADIQALMESESERSRVFLEAPPYFQTLLANYTCGITFPRGQAARAHDRCWGRGKNFLRTIADPPFLGTDPPSRSTGTGRRDEPVVIDDARVEAILTEHGYRVAHRNTAGEILAAVVTTPVDRVLNPLASALPSYWSNASSSGWGGDRFYLLERPEGPESPGLWITTGTALRIVMTPPTWTQVGRDAIRVPWAYGTAFSVCLRGRPGPALTPGSPGVADASQPLLAGWRRDSRRPAPLEYRHAPRTSRRMPDVPATSRPTFSGSIPAVPVEPQAVNR